MHVYILVAVDDDYRVRECVPVTDLKTAQDLFKILRETWGGDKVAMASRETDDIPQNLVDALLRPYQAESARPLPKPGVCPVCQGARFVHNTQTHQVVGCWECNAGGKPDKSLMPGKRWA